MKKNKFLKTIINALYISETISRQYLIYEAELLKDIGQNNIKDIIRNLRQVPKMQEQYYNNIAKKFNF